MYATDMLFVRPTVTLDGNVPVRNHGDPCFQYSSYTTNLLSRFILHVFTDKLGTNCDSHYHEFLLLLPHKYYSEYLVYTVYYCVEDACFINVL